MGRVGIGLARERGVAWRAQAVRKGLTLLVPAQQQPLLARRRWLAPLDAMRHLVDELVAQLAVRRQTRVLRRLGVPLDRLTVAARLARYPSVRLPLLQPPQNLSYLDHRQLPECHGLPPDDARVASPGADLPQLRSLHPGHPVQARELAP